MTMAAMNADKDTDGKRRTGLMVVGGVALLGLSVYLAAALGTWNVADPSLNQASDAAVTNLAGPSGAIIADLCMQLFGLASVLLVVLPFVWGLRLVSGRRINGASRRGWFALGGLILAATALGCFGAPAGWPLPIGLGGIAGDIVLQFPALVTGAFPSGLAGSILGMVLAAPAAWLFLIGLGVLGRDQAALPHRAVEERTRHAPIQAEELDEDAGEGRLQLLFGALTHGIYALRSAVRRPRAAAVPQPRRVEPVAERRAEPRMTGFAAPESAMAPAPRSGREIRVVDTRPQQPDFDSFDMDGFDAYGVEPDVAPQAPRAAPPRAAAAPVMAEPPRMQAFPDEAAMAFAPHPDEAGARRAVDTSRATVRHGRSDWNGSYAATRLGKKRWERDDATDEDGLREDPHFDEDAPFDANATAYADEDGPYMHDPAPDDGLTVEERMVEEEMIAYAQTPPEALEPEPFEERPVEKTGGWRDYIPANVVAFPGIGRNRTPSNDVAARTEPSMNPAMSPAMPSMEKPVRVVPAALPAAPARHAAPARVYQGEPAHAYQPEFFELPSINLLSPPRARTRDDSLTPEMLQENARLLEGVLDDFGVKGEIIEVRPGPVVTLYELEPAPGIKSSRVIGLADDIARSMSAIAARVAVIPGKNAIGIELPNRKRETVYLREMLAAESFSQNKGKLPLTLGKTIGGEPVIADLAKMPHLLVAGTTGSGKSVSINTMILSLLYRLTPSQCRMIMIDPKMLELSIYDGIPHLLSPVVTDPKKAVVALKWTVREMEDRYRKMSKIGVRNIDGFNARVAQAIDKGETICRTVQTGFDRETGEPIFESEEFDLQPLPYIVVIIDEMADLMMVAGKEIEGTVQRLAQMARAAGIHVIMATQRPSVDVITGTIKANFPTRISFQVTSKIDSRTILQEQGAEQLLGMGDMLFMAGGGRIQRVHGPFVDDSEVEAIVSHLKSQGVPDYLDSILEEEDEDDAPAGGGGGAAGVDEAADLYDQAVAIVLRDGKASTSYVQRRLQIGYNRAASIIERMEQEGVVGPANHAGKREILVPTDNA